MIDSAMYEEDGIYYLFVKSERNPGRILMLKSGSPAGPFERADEKFRFPSGFKHGTILKITEESYERIRAHRFEYADN